MRGVGRLGGLGRVREVKGLHFLVKIAAFFFMFEVRNEVFEQIYHIGFGEVRLGEKLLQF